ncbi:cell division cycle 25 homolog d isoform X6 [Oncorhynchus keta]|uniref:cell division cycle 25 homolog d isoform X6 n=1 Tax=Oncorhynchus keta TaxID=8018 RepID=UPI00227B83F5|nr:cell division cycle 25 homolog d isoform X6 [Oncorhynchus keta]XP_052384079.1 cell division cycle 25 homolog d isoform X6 [Oncorhynchus keta]XP_052384080.1 cell division cycle 25 homolog d isoform X6 [Oncorhynchus keta]
MKHLCCDGRMETHNIIIITQNRRRGMETFNVLGNEISPGDALPGQSHNEPVWSLSPSPGTGPSPVSELSFSLNSLRCHDGADTPRRKLRLTPELVTPSPPGPTPGSTCGRGLAPQGGETPTGNVLTDSGNRRRGERFLSPACSAPKMKRLRVKLSTRFCSAAVQRPDPGVRGLRCQGQSSPPGGGALRVRQGDVELPDVEALLSVRRVRARRRHFPPSSLLGSTMEDHTLTGDYSKPLLLPVERVEHQDLHCISAQTYNDPTHLQLCTGYLTKKESNGVLWELLQDCWKSIPGGRQPPHRGSDPGGFTPDSCPLPALLLGQSSHQPPWTGSRSRRQWYFHGWSVTEVQLTVTFTRKWYHATRTGVTHGGVIATETDCVPLRVLVREGPTSMSLPERAGQSAPCLPLPSALLP